MNMELTREEEAKAEMIGKLLAACASGEEPKPTVMLGTAAGSAQYWRRVAEVVLFHQPDVLIEYDEDFTP